MRRLGLLVAKDLRRKRRAPLGLLVALAFPLVFAGMIALVFGARGGDVPKVRLVVENRDDGFLSGAIASAFTSQQAAKYFDVRTAAKGAGRAVIEAGDASALLVIPERFTSDLLDGTAVTLQLVRNPAEGILPEVAEQIAAILTQVLDGGARVLREPLDRLRPYFREGSTAPSDTSVAEMSIAFKRTIEGAGTFVLPPAITLEGAFDGGDGETKPNDDRGGGAIFLAVLPGIAVYALFLVGDNAMRDILAEGTLGTLRRQLAGPVRPGTVVAAKALFAAILAILALVVFSVAAAAFGPVLSDPVAFVVLSLALILAVVGTGSAIYGVTGTERRGATFASIVYLAMGFLGGSFVQVDNLPATMQALARWTPFFWGTSGYRTLLERKGSLADVAPNVAVLCAIGLALLAVGTFTLGRRVRRGLAAA